MGWYSLVSLVADSRVKFLLGFVIVAVLVAGILTFIEVRLKKQKAKREERTAQDSFVEKLKRYIRSEKSPKEKLDYLDSTAKAYFKENYGTPAGASYSVLIEDFEKNKRTEFLGFCKEMFGAYYSSKESSNAKVLSLTNEFIASVKKRERGEEIARIPSVSEKISRSLDSFSRSIVGVFASAVRGLRAIGVKWKKGSVKRKNLREIMNKEKTSARQKKDLDKKKAMEEKIRKKQVKRLAKLKAKQLKKAFRQKEIDEMYESIRLVKQHKEEEKKKKILAEQKSKQVIVLKRQKEIALREEEYKKKRVEEEKQKKNQAKKPVKPGMWENWRKARLLRKSTRAKLRLEKKKLKEQIKQDRLRVKQEMRSKKIAEKKKNKEEKLARKAQRKREAEIRKKLLVARSEVENHGRVIKEFGLSSQLEKKRGKNHPMGSKGWLKSLKHNSGK